MRGMADFQRVQQFYILEKSKVGQVRYYSTELNNIPGKIKNL
jgi:hypothetical protein